MEITADQCRAARSLLNWSQDKLASEALISRATVADFENYIRVPTKNNLRAIEDSMFAFGIEFVGEEAGKGVGVRFRDRKLTYIWQVKIFRPTSVAIIPMKFEGHSFQCCISFEAICDFHGAELSTDSEYKDAVKDMFLTIIVTAERYAPTHIKGGQMLITTRMIADR